MAGNHDSTGRPALPAVDLSCDLGEDPTADGRGRDRDLISLSTSINIACGGHAGNESTMAECVRYAQQAGVVVGAHPGYEDPVHFGRRPMNLAPEELSSSIKRQLMRLQRVCAAQQSRIRHVKLHGALYHRAHEDATTAAIVAQALVEFDRELIVVGLPDKALLEACRQAGLKTAVEFFLDRHYQDDGSLVSRDREQALISDPAAAFARFLSVLQFGVVESVNSHPLAQSIDTACFHSDHPHVVPFIKSFRDLARQAGIQFRSHLRHTSTAD